MKDSRHKIMEVEEEEARRIIDANVASLQSKKECYDLGSALLIILRGHPKVYRVRITPECAKAIDFATNYL